MPEWILPHPMARRSMLQEAGKSLKPGIAAVTAGTSKSGTRAAFAHLSKLHVRKGSDVRIGRHIGNVGHTGIATGNHLHFELRKNGKPQNPLQWVILKDSRSKKSH